MPQSTKNGRGGAREGSGRKPLEDQSQVRSERITINVTQKELKQLSKAAAGTTISSFVRDLVIRSLKRRRKKK